VTLSLSDHRRVQILHFLVPAFGKATLNFKASLIAVSPAEVLELNNLIKSAVPTGQQGAYEGLRGADNAGGLSFLGLWAGQPDPTIAMTEIGIPAQMQSEIIKKISQLANSRNDFKYQTSVDNSKNDASTTGQLSVVTVDINLPNPLTGALMPRTIIAPDVTVTTKPKPLKASPLISTKPLYKVP
jgi:hypothetical protein|tara:strand:- start:20 stop:574 length:555 start_codon:yes stop_codon:yes gene_type:complete